MIKKSKFKIGQRVTVNGIGDYRIKDIATHGIGQCDCCGGNHYFMYQLSSSYWINEDQLCLYKGN
jgi:hypothetical protein